MICWPRISRLFCNEIQEKPRKILRPFLRFRSSKIVNVYRMSFVDTQRNSNPCMVTPILSLKLADTNGGTDSTANPMIATDMVHVRRLSRLFLPPYDAQDLSIRDMNYTISTCTQYNQKVPNTSVLVVRIMPNMIGQGSMKSLQCGFRCIGLSKKET